MVVVASTDNNPRLAVFWGLIRLRLLDALPTSQCIAKLSPSSAAALALFGFNL
jgi:hypothetical protein